MVVFLFPLRKLPSADHPQKSLHDLGDPLLLDTDLWPLAELG